ncbi:MAG: dihydrofolate reductase [Bacteroidaceae bacterium]|nr:dihydrofolate reductase [Bacteroidaceae bacterium]
MKRILMLMTAVMMCSLTKAAPDNFEYNNERFADLQMLRYKVSGFEQLSLRDKQLIYYLSEASLCGRDILFDQNGAYNLRIRQMLEAVYTDYRGDRQSADFKALEVYLKRVWFSNGIHHHYGCEKFVPGFSEAFFRSALKSVDAKKLPLLKGQTVDELCDVVFPVIFDPTIMKMRVNQKDGEDLVKTSASNYYGEGVTQAEAEAFYEAQKDTTNPEPVMYGLNSRLVKKGGKLVEQRWTANGLYGQAIKKIIFWLKKAATVADTPQQRDVINELIKYYKTGDLHTFDSYSILWLKDTESLVDFTNGFIESYGDPLGLKASWEAITNFKNLEASKRAEKLSTNAQWFEDNSPVDPRFKKEECRGISAKVITAAMLGGDLYPSTAIGINLPNSNWIRKQHGSKSVTIGNLTDAYNKAAHGNGFIDEFICDPQVKELVDKYADNCDDLHTDLHECLGHGSGRLVEGVSDDALKSYGSTIEEARADLFALYYLADPKLVELGLTPNMDAYKSEYYDQMMNGLMTQLVRIEPGKDLEEAHMRDRALIAHWAFEHGKAANVMELIKQNGKTYLKINDYETLRQLFSQLLQEVQRIKSEGDVEAARQLVETYGVKVNPEIHAEVLARYKALDLAPYKGFINPVYTPVLDKKGNITDVKVSYTEGYAEQMLRYSRDYSFLPFINE